MKFCARWVLRQFKDVHKQACLKACLELLKFLASIETFIELIVTDETYCNCCIHTPINKARRKLDLLVFD